MLMAVRPLSYTHTWILLLFEKHFQWEKKGEKTALVGIGAAVLAIVAFTAYMEMYTQKRTP